MPTYTQLFGRLRRKRYGRINGDVARENRLREEGELMNDFPMFFICSSFLIIFLFLCFFRDMTMTLFGLQIFKFPVWGESGSKMVWMKFWGLLEWSDDNEGKEASRGRRSEVLVLLILGLFIFPWMLRLDGNWIRGSSFIEWSCFHTYMVLIVHHHFRNSQLRNHSGDEKQE